jgi:hypothetical protein
MTRTIVSKNALLSLIAVFLVACMSAQERLDQVSSQLPIPEETILLASQTRVGPGYRRTCAVEVLMQLYGSMLSAEEVEDVYVTGLSDGGWDQRRSLYSEDSLIFMLKGRYKLVVDIDPSQSILNSGYYNFNYIDTVDANTLESYDTLFITELAYIGGPGCEFPEE